MGGHLHCRFTEIAIATCRSTGRERSRRVRYRYPAHVRGLEVYCGGAALTDRLYPAASATGVDLYAEGGVAHVKTVSVWPLRGTW